jgi:hypothetical protein
MAGGGHGFFSRGIGRHFAHSHADGLSSLTPMLDAVDFRDITTGSMSVRALGYITGVRG